MFFSLPFQIYHAINDDILADIIFEQRIEQREDYEYSKGPRSIPNLNATCIVYTIDIYLLIVSCLVI